MALRICSSLNKTEEIWSEGQGSASSDAPVFAFFSCSWRMPAAERWTMKDWFWFCYEEMSADNVVNMIPAFDLIVLNWT